jgi:hypothetical protein
VLAAVFAGFASVAMSVQMSASVTPASVQPQATEQTAAAASPRAFAESFDAANGSGAVLDSMRAPFAAINNAHQIGPLTRLHYAPNGNFGTGRKAGMYLPGADGFNLADVDTLTQLNSLPSSVKGLWYLGLCNGVESTFTEAVEQFIGNSKLFGVFLVDEPDPTGKYKPLCTASNLKAEADWIHANVPGVEVFITLMSLGTYRNPEYVNTYNTANTHIDLFGLDPYPCRKEFKGKAFPNGCDNNVIHASVAAAEAWGIATSQIVPVYQAFGGGGYRAWILPKASEEEQLLSIWGSLVPTPVFDFAYSWGSQENDHALGHSHALQAVFAAHNK